MMMDEGSSGGSASATTATLPSNYFLPRSLSRPQRRAASSDAPSTTGSGSFTWNRAGRFASNSSQPGQVQRGSNPSSVTSGGGTVKGMTAAEGDAIVLDGFFLLNACHVDDPQDAYTARISSCKLHEVVHEDLTLFSNLSVLDASENHIPFEPLGALPALRDLNLAFNYIRDIKQQSMLHRSFSHLCKLDLSYNNLNYRAILSLAVLPMLSLLDLSGNELSSLPDFFASSGFLQLTELILQRNDLYHLDTFAALARLPQLAKLNLSENKISAIPDLGVYMRRTSAPRGHDVGLFPALVSLDISVNLISTEDDLLQLTNWSMLRELNIFENPFTRIYRGLPPKLLSELVLAKGVTIHKLTPPNEVMRPEIKLVKESLRRIPDIPMRDVNIKLSIREVPALEHVSNENIQCKPGQRPPPLFAGETAEEFEGYQAPSDPNKEETTPKKENKKTEDFFMTAASDDERDDTDSSVISTPRNDQREELTEEDVARIYQPGPEVLKNMPPIPCDPRACVRALEYILNNPIKYHDVPRTGTKQARERYENSILRKQHSDRLSESNERSPANARAASSGHGKERKRNFTNKTRLSKSPKRINAATSNIPSMSKGEKTNELLTKSAQGTATIDKNLGTILGNLVGEDSRELNKSATVTYPKCTALIRAAQKQFDSVRLVSLNEDSIEVESTKGSVSNSTPTDSLSDLSSQIDSKSNLLEQKKLYLNRTSSFSQLNEPVSEGDVAFPGFRKHRRQSVNAISRASNVVSCSK